MVVSAPVVHMSVNKDHLVPGGVPASLRRDNGSSVATRAETKASSNDSEDKPVRHSLDAGMYHHQDCDVSLVATESVGSSSEEQHLPCDPKCFCGNASASCMMREGKFTICEIRKHNHAQSCWIVAGDTVYDTTDYIDRHPAGADCILRKAGGQQDCWQDLKFHSKGGRNMWKRCKIGKVVGCPCHASNTPGSSSWWTCLFR